MCVCVWEMLLAVFVAPIGNPPSMDVGNGLCSALLSSMIATGHILVFKFNLKLIEIKYKLKFSSSLKLATFQVFNSQTGLVAAVQI